MNKIVVMLPLKQEQKKKLEQASIGARFVYVKPKSITVEDVADADILIGNVPIELVQQCEHLKWIQLNTAGADPYYKEGMLPIGTKLTIATGAYGLALSEYMLSVLLVLMKKLNLYYTNQLDGIWRDEGEVSSIEGAQVLVLGMGDIGTEFGKRMKALGAHVTGVVRVPRQKPDYTDALITLDEVPDILGNFDVVVSCLPETAETCKLYDEKFFSAMKANSYFINVGRGVAVVTQDLVEALKSGHLAGAAVDVTDPEPLPEDHPLWHAPNVIVTPHIAGHFYLPQTLNRIVDICVENLIHFDKGEELRNQVDAETGYRKLV